MLQPQEHPDPSDTPPPPSLAVDCYRILLWLVPSGAAVTIRAILELFSRWLLLDLSDFVGWLWFLATLIFTVATGMFEARLRVAAGAITAQERSGVIGMFVLLQVVTIPLVYLIVALIFFFYTGRFIFF